MAHTVTAIDAELTDIAEAVTALGVLARAQIDDALTAVVGDKPALAERAIQRDPALDALAIEIERKAVRMIALRHPSADDLRRPLAAMKIATSLERCGDLAKSIAKRSLRLGSEGVGVSASLIERLGTLVGERLASVLDAQLTRDVGKLMTVWSQDVDIDAQYETLSAEVLGRMNNDGLSAASGAHLLFIAKNLERIGDHATNIAETMHYEITGVSLSPDRPRYVPAE